MILTTDEVTSEPLLPKRKFSYSKLILVIIILGLVWSANLQLWNQRAEAVDNADMQAQLLYMRDQYRLPSQANSHVSGELATLDRKYGYVQSLRVLGVDADPFYHPIIVRLRVVRRKKTLVETVMLNYGVIFDLQAEPLPERT